MTKVHDIIDLIAIYMYGPVHAPKKNEMDLSFIQANFFFFGGGRGGPYDPQYHELLAK